MIICKESPLSQRKNFSNTYCMHHTRVTRQYSSVFISQKPVYLQYFDSVYIFQDVKIIFLLRNCKFTIRDVCTTPSNIDDRSFCDNSMQHSFKVVRFSCKKVHSFLLFRTFFINILIFLLLIFFFLFLMGKLSKFRFLDITKLIVGGWNIIGGDWLGNFKK